MGPLPAQWPGGVSRRGRCRRNGRYVGADAAAAGAMAERWEPTQPLPANGREVGADAAAAGAMAGR